MYINHVIELVKELEERPGELAETPVDCAGLRV